MDHQEVEDPGRMDQRVGHGHRGHPDEGVLCGMAVEVDHGDKGPREVGEEVLWHRGQQDGAADGTDPSVGVADHMDQYRDHAAAEEEVDAGSPGLGCAS